MTTAMTTKTLDPRPTPMGLVLEAAESIPVNLESLARQLGIRLVRTPLDDSICGCIERTADGWRLIVNAEHSRSRQRFTIAHELGHFVLHATALGDGTNDTRKYRATATVRTYNHTLDDRHEREANQFATSLLMPAAKVQQFQQVMQADDPGYLAELFQVSRGAMKIRLEELAEAEEETNEAFETIGVSTRTVASTGTFKDIYSIYEEKSKGNTNKDKSTNEEKEENSEKTEAAYYAQN